MSKHSKQSLSFLTAIAISLTGLGVAVNKAEAQSQSTVGCPHCNVFSSQQNPLYFRRFNGQTFDSLSSPPEGLEVEPGLAKGIFRGWSWNNGVASYVIVDGNGRNILIVRPFDGRTFGSVTSSQTVSSRDVFQGWSWDGNVASYVTK